MAEMVAIMAVRPLVSMLMSKASSALLDEYNVMEGMEEQHKILKRKLPAILDVITDAEKQATEHRDGAKAWLHELKTVAYQANEVFDEFKYEALRREAKKKGHFKELGFDAIKLFPTHNRIVFRYKMGRKLCRILQAIDILIAEMQVFGFKYQPQSPVSMQWRQTDYVIFDPQEIASRSRDKDKSNIVDTLLRQANKADLAIVSIVGMGGLGKTTLAQLIYNEPEIQKHFQLQLWVCVSNTFDVNSLAKCIVESSHKKNDDTNKPPLDRLKNLVSGQRYLLVLDDVWNREVHKWERLKACLQHGASGSAVLTTTRDKQVAEIMDANKAHNLNGLEDSFIEEIIEARAFSLRKEKPAELVEMVGGIVKRCSGSPLAATALGSVLCTKTNVKEWEAILSGSSICTEETGILSILKLSYNDLPSHMKQCFAFCAVFPKDYKINVMKLIQLWIANGFIPEHKGREDDLEIIGRHIFYELASRSFFLDIDERSNFLDNDSVTTCKIHDLMHDVAMAVMEEECVVANQKPTQTEWLPDIARHLYLSWGDAAGILNNSMKKRSPAIQTLLCDSYMSSPLEHLSKYSSLHALKVRIRLDSFLLKSTYLHKLRYLDISDSRIKEFPEDITILYNLQMLDVSNCFDLGCLPMQMKYMTSLRHLYTDGCRKLKNMPPELGKLTKLHTLTYFVAGVSSPDCSDVAELQHLNLGGQLEVCQMENVDEGEVKVANLVSKKDLRELTLRWTSVSDSKVLDNFEPHDQLHSLQIYSYGGKSVGMLQNMVEIHLSHCETLKILFSHITSFTFPKLKQLRLEHLWHLEVWWEVNERKEEQIIFPLLEKLFIKYCEKLIALPEGPFPELKVLELKCLKNIQTRWDVVEQTQGVDILFPQLEKLSIEKCPKLTDLPEAPKLSVLEVNDGNQEFSYWVHEHLSSLTELELRLENTETTSGAECNIIVPVDSKKKWKSPLRVMRLRCCNSFFGSGGLEPLDYFVHIEKLEIFECSVLVHWPEKAFQSLVSLRTLYIEDCENLTGYAQDPLEPSASERSRYLPGLENIYLMRCSSLVEMFNVPASVVEIFIIGCQKLESILGKQQGMSELSSSPMNHPCPCLEYIYLKGCDSLSGVLHLPSSLRILNIESCSNIQVLSCQLDGLPKPQVGTSINVLEPSATAAREHSLPTGLTHLHIISCAGMLGGILHLPTSLEILRIHNNSRFTSLACLPGEPPSLEMLSLIKCSTLTSLPNEPQAYQSLGSITIKDCAALKKIPRCLQQQLGHLPAWGDVELDARYKVMAFHPKTWKHIPELVRQRRLKAVQRDEERRQADCTIEEQETPAIAIHTEE